MHLCKWIVIGLILLLTTTVGATEKTLTLIHTNDLHSHFLGFAPNSDFTPQQVGDDETRGGWARLATLIKTIQGQRPNPVLVLDGGDFLMGSLFTCRPAKRPLSCSSCNAWDTM